MFEAATEPKALRSTAVDLPDADWLPSGPDLFRLLPSSAACVRLIALSSSRMTAACGPGCAHRWRQVSDRLFRCDRCKAQWAPTRRTMFDNCNVDMRVFFLAALIVAQSPRLVSGAQLSDMLGISHNSAVKLRTKLWRRLAELGPRDSLGGEGTRVEVDELLVSRYVRWRATQHRWTAIGITDGRSFRVFLAADRRRATLWPLIEANVAPGSIINTDGWRAYRGVESLGFAHIWCDHSKGIFMGDDGASTTTIDGYWREVKLSLSHTHQGVSEALLELFLQAHAARYSFRDRHGELFWSLVGCDPTILASDGWESGAWEPHVRYAASAASPNSFIGQADLLTREDRARALLAQLVLEREPSCPACGRPRASSSTLSEARFRCAGCGKSQTIRAGSIYADSRLQLTHWFTLVWLMSACRDGPSIQFASNFVGVSRQAVIAMLKAIRSAMVRCHKGERIGGHGRTVHVGLFHVRVRRPEGHSRSTRRTVLLGYDGERFSADVLHQRSSRYVMLWAKKRLHRGSDVHHPGGVPFALLEQVPGISVVRDKHGRKHSPARGTMAGIKRHLIRCHTRVPHEHLQLYLKELEFKRFHRGKNFVCLLHAVSFGDQAAG